MKIRQKDKTWKAVDENYELSVKEAKDLYKTLDKKDDKNEALLIRIEIIETLLGIKRD